VEPRAQVLLFGVDLFSTSAEQVIAELRVRYEVEVDQGDCGLVVPELSVGMSRSGVPFPARIRRPSTTHVFRERAYRESGLLRPAASERGVMSTGLAAMDAFYAICVGEDGSSPASVENVSQI
jgi:hypothetical protein